MKNKVLHIAAFSGNIGDKINHDGFYNTFGWLLDDYEIDKIDIRDFYFSKENHLVFDVQMANRMNNYSFVIIGGGGFFDVRWMESSTATTLNMTKEFIDLLRVPIWINAIGYHEYGDNRKELNSKFEEFMDYVKDKSNWIVTVRNDGSYERIINSYGNKYGEFIVKVADGGFLTEVEKTSNRKKNNKKKVVGICFNNELISKEYNGNIDDDFVLTFFLELVKELMCDCDIIFLPHTINDCLLIARLLERLNSDLGRRIIVAPYCANSDDAVLLLSEYYQMCDVIVAMRFHAVIFAVVNNISVYAISQHAQIEALMNDIGLGEECVRFNELADPKEISNRIINSDSVNKYDTVRNYIDELECMYVDKIKESVLSMHL